MVSLSRLVHVSIVGEDRLELDGDEVCPLHQTHLLAVAPLQEVEFVLNGILRVRLSLKRRVHHHHYLVRLTHHVPAHIP